MRGPPVRLRQLTFEERAAVAALARSWTAPARRVERARVVRRASRGETPPAIAATLGLNAETVRRRIRRLDAEGLAAVDDYPRPGRPATYSTDEVATVIAAALTGPRRLGLPFASWTLDRLAAYLLEQRGIAMRRSRIDETLLAEGLRWRRHETWFGERVDPEFAERGGGSRGSTPRRRRAAWSSAWTVRSTAGRLQNLPHRGGRPLRRHAERGRLPGHGRADRRRHDRRRAEAAQHRGGEGGDQGRPDPGGLGREAGEAAAEGPRRPLDGEVLKGEAARGRRAAGRPRGAGLRPREPRLDRPAPRPDPPLDGDRRGGPRRGAAGWRGCCRSGKPTGRPSTPSTSRSVSRP